MAKKTKAVKMADIAKELEVSTVTVSKALSDQNGVSEELRAKIKALAEEMGYKPLSAIKAGKTRSYNIGVLISDRYLDFYESFYWKMYQEIINCAMQKSSFTMLEVINEEAEEYGILPKLVTEGKVDGLIVIGRPGNNYAAMLRSKVKLPLVFLDFYDADVKADAIISDGFYGTYELTNYLIEKGHKEIGFVGTLHATESITDRYLGYVKALLEHDLGQKPDYIIDDRDKKTGINLQATDIKFPKKMPTALVCNCDNTAAIVAKALIEKGYKIPEDISIVGFDNYLMPGSSNVEISTYEVNVHEMARITINTLIKKISGENYQKGIRIVEGKLIEKSSVRSI